MNPNSSAGLGNLARQFYLAWKALRDPSIPWAAKWLIPLAAIAYWISPVDLMPFLPFDDIVVVLIALNFFLRTMSQYQTMGQPGSPSHNENDPTDTDQEAGKTIETTWRVIDE